MSLAKIADILVKEKDIGKFYDIPTFILPTCLISFGALFISEFVRFRKYLEKKHYDNQTTISVLGIKRFIDTK